jgi:hypothetical protein
MSKKPENSEVEFQDPLMRMTQILGDGDRRIYVVVANSVQVPMGLDMTYGHEILYRVPDALSIKQVAGRAAMQNGHAKALVHLIMAERALAPFMQGKYEIPKDDEYLTKLWDVIQTPVTSIMLAARDSFELHHVYRLLEQRLGGKVYPFYDENKDVYGVKEDGTPHKVMTAIATEPIPFVKTGGILDYLDLWRPEN